MESLDHILFSGQFYDHSEQRRWSFHEMKAYNDHLFETHRLRKDETPHLFPSDHGMVKVVFDHKPASG